MAKNTFSYLDLKNIESGWHELQKEVPWWMEEIRKAEYKPLSKDKELDLIAYAKKNNCKASKDKVIKANLRFVANLSRRYILDGVDIWETISAGNTGLLNAFDKFDVEKNVKLITYGVNHIRASFIDQLRQTQAIKLSARAVQTLNDLRLCGTVKEMKSRFPNRYPQDEMKIEDKIEGYLNIKFMSSLNDSYDDGDEVGSNIETKELSTFKESFQVHALLFDTKAITTRQKEVLSLAFGIDGDEPHTVREISTILDISPSKAAKLRKTGLLQLRENEPKFAELYDLLVDESEVTYAVPNTYTSE